MEIKRTRKKRANPMANLSQHLAGPVEKDSRVLQAEIALRRNLRAGSWEKYVPGIRTLASSFGVSPATMVKAVERVRSDGWISNEGARRRFTIHRDVILKSKGKEQFLRTLLLLAPKTGRNEPARGTSQILLHLWEILAPKGWSIRFHLDDYANGKRRQKQWDDLVEVEKPQAVVAMIGTPAMAAWARDAKTPMFFCGGSLEDFPVPIAAISSSLMLEEALDQLIARGHYKITMPLCQRGAAFTTRQKSTISSKLIEAGYDFITELNVPTTAENTLADFCNCLDRAFAVSKPTAIICLDWREYLAALSYVQKKGLSVPEDISLVSLSNDHAADWLSPEPSRFLHPLDKLAATLANWLEDMSTYNDFQLVAPLRGVWIPGGTMAPPRA
jgi:DNA-binding LacI/PurR family transcriptional regulator